MQGEGDFIKYFSIQLQNNFLEISTTNAFINYEKEQYSTNPVITINFACTSGSTSVNIRFNILEANNYDPEFSQPSFEIMVSTPLPFEFDITYFMSNGDISAVDYDLYGNDLTFEISESNLFKVDAVVDRSGIKPVFKVRILTTQTILKFNDTEIYITAKVNLINKNRQDFY